MQALARSLLLTIVVFFLPRDGIIEVEVVFCWLDSSCSSRAASNRTSTGAGPSSWWTVQIDLDCCERPLKMAFKVYLTRVYQGVLESSAFSFSLDKLLEHVQCVRVCFTEVGHIPAATSTTIAAPLHVAGSRPSRSTRQGVFSLIFVFF